MTLDELKAIKDPLSHYQKGSAQADIDFVGIAQASVGDLAGNLGKWLNHFAQAFSIQNSELALLRTLEHHCRCESLTPEGWDELRGKLDAFRTELAAKIAASTEAANAAQPQVEKE